MCIDTIEVSTHGREPIPISNHPPQESSSPIKPHLSSIQEPANPKSENQFKKRPKSCIININTPYIHTPSYPNIKSHHHHHPIQPFTPKSHQINPYPYPPTHLSTYPPTLPPLPSSKNKKTKSSTTHNACVHANPVHICIQPSICSPNATFPPLHLHH